MHFSLPVPTSGLNGVSLSMWTVDPATGHLGEKITTQYRLSYLLPDRQGAALYSLDPGSPYWQSNVRLVRIDPATGIRSLCAPWMRISGGSWSCPWPRAFRPA
jgi:hypothetical protein